MKKILSIIISIMMVMTMVPTMAFAEEAQDIQFGEVHAYSAEGEKIGSYDTFRDALKVVNDIETYPGIVKLVCDKDTVISNGGNHIPVKRSIVVEGNGSAVVSSKVAPYTGEADFAIEEDKNIGQPEGSNLFVADTSIEINNLYNGAVWGTRYSTYKLTVKLNNCDTHPTLGNTGQRIYINGATGENDITLNNCDIKDKRCTVYSNAAGSITLNNCSFVNVAEPININTKASNGNINISVNNTSFKDCGLGTADDKQWAAPIRVVNSQMQNGNSTVNVDNCVFEYSEGNEPANGDILIGDGRLGKSSYNVEAKITNTKANIRTQQPGYYVDGTTDPDKQIEKDVEKNQTATVTKDSIVVEDKPVTPPTPPTPSVPSNPEPEVVPPTVDAEGNIESTVKPDESGKVETTVPSETITESLDKVTQSPSEEKPVVEIVVKEEAGSKPADSVDVKVPAEAVDKVAKTEDASLKVTTSVGTVELDNDALNKVASEANGEVVTITVEKQDVDEITSEAQKETIESFGKEDYVFEISVRAGSRMIRQLEGEMTFEVDYELKEGELPENVRVYCVDEEGNKQRVEAKYDEKTKKLVMKTDYLSIFAVSYVDAPSKVRVLKANNEKGKAALRWSRATNGPEGYRIYRAKTKDGKYSPIAWVKDGKAKTFKEKAKKTNKTYYYKVRAYKNVDGKKVWGEYSPVKKLKF